MSGHRAFSSPPVSLFDLGSGTVLTLTQTFCLSLSHSASEHIVDLPLPARMIALASWQLLLLLCITTFGEPLAKVAPLANPGPTGTNGPGDGAGESLNMRITIFFIL